MDGRRARIVLGVGADAGPAEIRRAFRLRALSAHPDHGGNPRAFSELQQAFDLLRGAAPEPPRRHALRAAGPSVDVYDSVRTRPRRDFADVLRAATARIR
jgi:hypothetical protein